MQNHDCNDCYEWVIGAINGIGLAVTRYQCLGWLRDKTSNKLYFPYFFKTMKAKYMFIVILDICRAQMNIVTLFSERQSDKYSAVHQRTHSVIMIHH